MSIYLNIRHVSGGNGSDLSVVMLQLASPTCACYCRHDVRVLGLVLSPPDVVELPHRDWNSMQSYGA